MDDRDAVLLLIAALVQVGGRGVRLSDLDRVVRYAVATGKLPPRLRESDGARLARIVADLLNDGLLSRDERGITLSALGHDQAAELQRVLGANAKLDIDAATRAVA